MLNQTTVTGIQALVYVAHRDGKAPIPPAEIATQLGASPAYLSKIHTQLAKAGILRAHRGVKGGVTLAKAPREISLLEVVEACQGRILGDYCAEHDNLDDVCAFHAAMHELREGTVRILAKWSLADMLSKPLPVPALRGKVNCRMAATLPPE